MGNSINTDLILSYIKENNISKAEFCKKCKISYSTLEKVLSGKNNFRTTILVNLSLILQIHIYELFIF